jgi:hypothetical protein
LNLIEKDELGSGCAETTSESDVAAVIAVAENDA